MRKLVSCTCAVGMGDGAGYARESDILIAVVEFSMENFCRTPDGKMVVDRVGALEGTVGEELNFKVGERDGLLGAIEGCDVTRGLGLVVTKIGLEEGNALPVGE